MMDNVIHLINTVIGHNVTYRMREQRITLTELARRSNMRKGQLSGIANGKNSHPSVWTMAKIASGLGCTVDDLISIGGYDD
jgi:transcriptional regulator with XRE-family HTH domain